MCIPDTVDSFASAKKMAYNNFLVSSGLFENITPILSVFYKSYIGFVDTYAL